MSEKVYYERTAVLSALHSMCTHREFEALAGQIVSIVPADVAPVVHGHWHQITASGIVECSNCGCSLLTYDLDCYKFCHSCGAKMDESEGESKSQL